MDTWFQGGSHLQRVSQRCTVFHQKWAVTVVLTVVLFERVHGSILAENRAQKDRPFVDLFC
jgi:hypothetical protein